MPVRKASWSILIPDSPAIPIAYPPHLWTTCQVAGRIGAGHAALLFTPTCHGSAGCQALHQHSHHPSALKFAKYFCLHYLIQVSYNPLKLGDAYYPLSVSTQEWRPKKANILRTIELVCDKVRILRLTLNPAVFLVQESASSSITL